MAKRKNLTSKEHVFVQRVIAGDTQSDAYRAAYPTSHKWSNRTVAERACVLAKKDNVAAEIDRIRARGEDRALDRRERLLQQFGKLAFAKLPDQISADFIESLTPTQIRAFTALVDAMIAAGDRIARLEGLYRDKTQVEVTSDPLTRLLNEIDQARRPREIGQAEVEVIEDKSEAEQ